MKKSSKVLLLILLLIIGQGSNKAFAERQVLVQLNGEVLDFDVDPVIVDGSTFVPMRKIFEELGAEVNWNEKTKTITSKREDKTIVMRPGDKKLTVNGKEMELETAIFTKKGRTMVPLRIISEALGEEVKWSGKDWTVYIDSKIIGKEVLDEKIERERSPQNISAVNGEKELYLGMDVKELKEIMGKPTKEEKFSNNYGLYIYNKDNSYEDYLKVGIYKGEVVEFETNSKNWTFDGKYTALSKVPEDRSEITKRYYDDGVCLLLSTGDNDTIITFIRIYIGEGFPNIENTLNDLRIIEDLVFDYSNVIRVGNGLKPLKNNANLKKLARNHNDEMLDKNYFSHNDYLGRDFSHRANTIENFSMLGENICSGYRGAGEAVNAWYNSKGHKENILNPKFEELGVGYNKGYCTQNFGTFFK